MSTPIAPTILLPLVGARFRGTISLANSGLGLVFGLENDEPSIIDLRMSRLLNAEETQDALYVAGKRLEREAAELSALGQVTPTPTPQPALIIEEPEDEQIVLEVPDWIPPVPLTDADEVERDAARERRTAVKMIDDLAPDPEEVP